MVVWWSGGALLIMKKTNLASTAVREIRPGTHNNTYTAISNTTGYTTAANTQLARVINSINHSVGETHI